MLLLEELTYMLLLYYYRCNIIQEIHDGQQYLNLVVGQDLLHPYQRNYAHKEHTILLPLITLEGIKKS